MMKIELLYDLDCPNVQMTRAALLEALSRAGIQPSWTEWNRKDPQAPDYVRNFGSPTILVNGQDVGGHQPGQNEDSCRLYVLDDGRFGRVPSVSEIVKVLERTSRTTTWWHRTFAFLPAAGVAFLPFGTCPACWPAYAGILSALGLGFFLHTKYLLPLAIILVGFALTALWYQARNRHGYRPLIVGGVGGSLLLLGKFVISSDLILYGGVLLLLTSSVWNAWPRRVAITTGSCPKCTEGSRVNNCSK